MQIRVQQVDTMIVGQGLAGSMLAWQLQQQGQRILLLGDEAAACASRVAAGLFNPVTGQRLVLQAGSSDLIPAARSLYRQLEHYFGRSFFHEKPMLRIIRHGKERVQYEKRKTDKLYTPYLGSYIDTVPELHCEHGLFAQTSTGYLDTNALLDSLKAHFIAQDCYINCHFQYSDLICKPQAILWQGWQAKQIIFCEGAMATTNPWFNWLPFQASKGEILTLNITAPTGLPDAIIHGGKWLLPLGGQRYKTGATFSQSTEDNAPTAAARDELETGAQALISAPLQYNIVDHQAGIRPNTRDKQPFIGFHPRQQRIAIFNGFGSKGSMLIPYYARLFAQAVVQQEPLPAQVDIARIPYPQRTLTRQVHQSLQVKLQHGSIAIDATAGNGHDTLFLARQLGEAAQLFAFDIQPDAIEQTRLRLATHGLAGAANLCCCNHADMAQYIPAALHGHIDVVVFNLGYLPHGDHSMITKTASTLAALSAACHMLAPTGYISILAYPGHPGGQKETEAVKHWAAQLPASNFHVHIHPPTHPASHAPEWIEITALPETML